jgi:hypothetical protein
MAQGRLWVTMTPESATLLQSRNTSAGDAGRLATLAYRRNGLWRRSVGRG